MVARFAPTSPQMPGAARAFPFSRLAWFLACMLAFATGCRDGSSPTDSPASSNAPAKASTSSGSEARPTGADPSTPLKVVVVDDPALAQALQREWGTIAEEPLELDQLTAAEVESSGKLPVADIVIYPTAILGPLAEREYIVPLPDSLWNGERLDRRDLLELSRKRFAMWGEKPYAIPLGEPFPVLLYRADILERLEVAPPTVWSEFQALASRVSTREDVGNLAPPADSAWLGIVEPLAAGSAAQTFLLRAAPYSRHRNQYSTLFDLISMEPMITSPPYVRALEELVETHAMNPGPVLEMTADDVRRELLAGRAAAAITWPVSAGSQQASPDQNSSEAASAPASGEGEASDSQVDDSVDDPVDESAPAAGVTVRIGVAPIPGSRDCYVSGQKKWEQRPEEDPLFVPVLGLSGRLGSVTRLSRRAGAGANLLAMLSSADWSARVLNASPATGPSRSSHLDSPDRWVDERLQGEPARQYARVVRDAQGSPQWFMVPRIPGQSRYLAALDDAVRAAVRGEQAPAEALASAASQWRNITEELGRDKQKRAYRRCLGIDP